MTEHDYVDWRDNSIETTNTKDARYVPRHYVYIVFDTNVEHFEDVAYLENVFYGVFATKESAENEADRIADKLYDGDRTHRNHIKVRKEKVR